MSPARYVAIAAFVVMIASLIPERTKRTNDTFIVAALVLALATVLQ